MSTTARTASSWPTMRDRSAESNSWDSRLRSCGSSFCVRLVIWLPSHPKIPFARQAAEFGFSKLIQLHADGRLKQPELQKNLSRNFFDWFRIRCAGQYQSGREKVGKIKVQRAQRIQELLH